MAKGSIPMIRVNNIDLIYSMKAIGISSSYAVDSLRRTNISVHIIELIFITIKMKSIAPMIIRSVQEVL